MLTTLILFTSKYSPSVVPSQSYLLFHHIRKVSEILPRNAVKQKQMVAVTKMRMKIKLKTETEETQIQTDFKTVPTTVAEWQWQRHSIGKKLKKRKRAMCEKDKGKTCKYFVKLVAREKTGCVER